jgi:hypothetical protein
MIARSQLRDAALSLLWCSGAPSCPPGKLSISRGFNPHSIENKNWLAVGARGRVVFRAFWTRMISTTFPLSSVMATGDQS